MKRIIIMLICTLLLFASCSVDSSMDDALSDIESNVWRLEQSIEERDINYLDKEIYSIYESVEYARTINSDKPKESNKVILELALIVGGISFIIFIGKFIKGEVEKKRAKK